jgi:hypothetical protein
VEEELERVSMQVVVEEVIVKIIQAQQQQVYQ